MENTHFCLEKATLPCGDPAINEQDYVLTTAKPFKLIRLHNHVWLTGSGIHDQLEVLGANAVMSHSQRNALVNQGILVPVAKTLLEAA